MRRDEAREVDYPFCENHPPLVYEGSVEPLQTLGANVYHDYYRCAVCGLKQGRYKRPTGRRHT
jgi:hypothetical protein